MNGMDSVSSSLSFWSTCENLSTINEDSAGEILEKILDEGQRKSSFGKVRLDSEGEEFEELLGEDEFVSINSASYGYLEMIQRPEKGYEDACKFCKVWTLHFSMHMKMVMRVK